MDIPTATSAPPEWVKMLPNEKATKPDSWPPKSSHYFDWKNWETHKVYSDVSRKSFETSTQPNFAQARSRLDYDYHRKPALRRQELQDVILSRVVSANPKHEEDTRKKPWIVFTAGAMGVGKGYTMSTLFKSNLFPLDTFLKVDPDMIKNELPEMSGYLQVDPASAATKIHRESTQMADVLLEQALMDQTNALVDGSLRDVDYYTSLLTRVRKLGYRIGIILVTAQPDVIHDRAKKRAEKTGRAVPEELLEESMEKAPKSVEKLAPLADVTYEIVNNDDEPLGLVKFTRRGEPISDLSWETFRDTWADDDSVNNENTDDNKSGDASSESSKKDAKTCTLAKLLKKKRSTCSVKPICSSMSSCWNDHAAHDSAMGIWGKAYPNFCPRCTLSDDGQCGVCVHGNHLCACKECESACPVRSKLKEAMHLLSSSIKSSCSITKSKEKDEEKNK